MTNSTHIPAPPAFKPDLEDAARRWDPFYAGEAIEEIIELL